MRVAIFTDTYQPQINGVTNTLDRMIQYFEKQSIDYRIFAPHYGDTDIEKKVERFYSLRFFLYPECRVTLPNIFRVHAALNEFKPDVIHLMTEFKLRCELGLENKVALLYVGRVAAEKDMDILRDSYHSINRKYPDQVRLVIVGDGPMLETCRSTFPADTIFLGFCKGQELARIYASCDIFVSPSSTETFGNVVLEAMASGLAVIGADAGGVGEIIRPLRTGLHFSSRSSQSLTQMTEKLIVDASFRHQLQMQGRQDALSRDWQQILNGLVDLYNAVVYEEVVAK